MDLTDFIDPYLDPGTGELRNLVGATTRAELDSVEAALSWARYLDLDSERIAPTRDLLELRAIHRYLFQDVFDWAGQLRTVDIRKNTDGATYFVPVSLIQRAAHFTFTELAEDEHLKGLDRPRFVDRLAYHYDQLNYVHPFREGNGRAQRAFWDRVALAAGRSLDWTTVTGTINDEASRLAADTRDLTLLIVMLDKVVSR